MEPLEPGNTRPCSQLPENVNSNGTDFLKVTLSPSELASSRGEPPTLSKDPILADRLSKAVGYMGTYFTGVDCGIPIGPRD